MRKAAHGDERTERGRGAGDRRRWDDWLDCFRSVDAPSLSHHEIASALITELEGTVDNLGWWAQTTAVAYEQHMGRRVPGQRPDGTFQTNVSRSTPLTMAALMEAWSAFAATDEDVLARVTDDVRVSGTANRITWRTKGRDGASVIVISEPKKGETASLVV